MTTAAPRAPVHTGAPGPLGAAHPRQEGPPDLRLVPPALAAWATAALTLDAPTAPVLITALICAIAAAALLTARRPRTPRTAAHPDGAPDPHPARRHRASAAALLLCAAAAATSATLHGADLRRGPLPELARRYAPTTLDVEITGDPRRTRPRVTGDHTAPTLTLIRATALRTTTQHGRSTTTSTPILLITPARDPWGALLPTTRLRVTARLTPPDPHDHDIAAVARTPDETPRVIRGPTAVQRLAGHLRAGLRTATEPLGTDARALLPGLVIGDTSRMPPELTEAFKATDLVHLTAVSGANFTLLLALLTGPPGLSQRAERRGLAPLLGIGLRTTALLGACLTAGFVILCRPEPSVLRAAACGGIGLLAVATGRRRSLVPALAAAVLLLVLYDPRLARSYGFLLSVLATASLLTLAPRLAAALRHRGLPPRLAEALAAAGAAQLACTPVIAGLAARVSLVAIPCNILAELAVAPATVLGFGALATAPFAMPLARGLARCAGLPAGAVAQVARGGAALPGADMGWPGGAAGGLLLVPILVGLLWAARRLRARRWPAVVCAGALVLFVVQPPPVTRVLTGWPPPGWRMVLCDVGQGDTGVLAAGKGTAVVVDTGPDPALADDCLRSLGITRVPLVLLTHFHADHVSGLPGVLRGRSVGAIETTGLRDPPGEAASVDRTAAAHGLRVSVARAGERRRIGDLSWEVLWPPPGPSPADENANDASVTLLVRTHGLRLLLLGDLEPDAQHALATSPAAGELARVDVLKVAHHGSAYQDNGLLATASPRLALIPVGTDNPYGHPSPRTVDTLRARGTRVLRTDKDGSVAVTGAGGEGLGTVTRGHGGVG
ncbi:ComEC/Rec2 family competence protein [Streptomyces sp. NPDC050560]|uniref:ComEC/Rec2 family competence protein n=1 Tax=Streptomyces sp. NPDC050560 TaxID=3365630 RepID=UPI0037ABB4F2